jgi:hypothetical protein
MLPNEAPTRRDVSFLLMVAAVVLEYNRVKNLSGWKEKPPASE